MVQQSVIAAEEDEVENPADILDAMQDRFMVYGSRSRSPVNWALKLRSMARKSKIRELGLDISYGGMTERSLATKGLS